MEQPLDQKRVEDACEADRIRRALQDAHDEFLQQHGWLDARSVPNWVLVARSIFFKAGA